MPNDRTSITNDPFQCPDHFWFERQHPGALVAWAAGLLAMLFVMGSLASRLRGQAHVGVDGAVPVPAASVAPL